jgi:hypothetical protein
VTWALPLATLLLAGGSLVLSTVFAARSLSRSASADYVGQLEKRITECERDRADLHRQVRALQRREVDLLTRIVKLENGDH